jgi:hypothetical protein
VPELLRASHNVIVRLALPEVSFALQFPVDLACRVAFPSKPHTSQASIPKALHENMSVVWHQYKASEPIALLIEEVQSFGYDGPEVGLPQQAFAVSLIEVFLHLLRVPSMKLRSSFCAQHFNARVPVFVAISINRVLKQPLLPPDGPLIEKLLWHRIKGPKREKIAHSRLLPMWQSTLRNLNLVLWTEERKLPRGACHRAPRSFRVNSEK